MTDDGVSTDLTTGRTTAEKLGKHLIGLFQLLLSIVVVCVMAICLAIPVGLFFGSLYYILTFLGVLA